MPLKRKKTSHGNVVQPKQQILSFGDIIDPATGMMQDENMQQASMEESSNQKISEEENGVSDDASSDVDEIGEELGPGQGEDDRQENSIIPTHGECLFYCEGCGLTFCDKEILSQHPSSYQLGIRKLSEEKDPKTYEKFVLNGKASVMYKVKPVNLSDYDSSSTRTLFICTCGFAASGSQELADHSSIHAIEVSSECAVCKAIFQNSHLLQQHVHSRKHYWSNEGKHPSRPSLASLADPIINSINSPAARPLITSTTLTPNVTFKASDYLTDGNKGAMDLAINGLKSLGGSLKCGQCSFSSSSARDLLNHRKIHMAQAQPVAMLRQEMVVSETDDNYSSSYVTNVPGLLKCGSCSFSTKSASDLLHHRKFHNSEGPFRCNVCSYASRRAIDLLEHKKEKSCSGKNIQTALQRKSPHVSKDLSTNNKKITR